MSYIEKFCLKEGICQLLHVTLTEQFSVFFLSALQQSSNYQY